jgi:hypothetical protein
MIYYEKCEPETASVGLGLMLSWARSGPAGWWACIGEKNSLIMFIELSGFQRRLSMFVIDLVDFNSR